MANGVVTLRGRFKPGARVRLVQVKDETVLRAEGGNELEARTVDEHGCVQFEGVKVGGYFFLAGQIDGEPVEVRARGKEPDEDNPVLTHAPVRPERAKLASGAWADEIVPATAPREGIVSAPEMSGMVSRSPEPSPTTQPKRRSAPRKSSPKKAAAKTSAGSKGSAAKKSTAPRASSSTTAKTSARGSARKEK